MTERATTWTLADGYLPAQITTFPHDGATVSITEFADRVVIGGNAFVVAYCRVAVHNVSGHAVRADPGPSSGLVELATGPDTVAPHTTAVHDYAVAVDRFGRSYAWPTSAALAGVGGFDTHFAHMRAFWNAQLAGVAHVTVPDRALEDAYESGFIYTQIARSGNGLDTGVNDYELEYSHDVVGILATLFTQGYFTDAHDLLLEARNVVGAQAQYPDGVWTYAWPWAIYLMKTGDVAFVKAHFSTPGPRGSTDQPSIEDTAHTSLPTAPGRAGSWVSPTTSTPRATGPSMTTRRSWAWPHTATWRSEWETPPRPSGRSPSTTACWPPPTPRSAPPSLSTGSTICRAPYSSPTPPTAVTTRRTPTGRHRLKFGKWAWDAPEFGAAVSGPGIALIDATYDYGFGRLAGVLPANTLGGFPPDFYSSAYNAGYGSWGLASQDHRDQGILGYQFMIANTQSGPDSWWESDGPPAVGSPWVGNHPTSGQGSSPHAWGISQDNKVLLDSLVAQSSDGALVVGRGVPDAWLRRRTPWRCPISPPSAAVGWASPSRRGARP